MAASSTPRKPRTTTRKPSSRARALSAVDGDTPGGVDFNMDTYEREGERPKPFTTVIGGRRIVLSDPTNLDWQDLADMDDPFELADKCMRPEDRDYFLEHRAPAYKLQAMAQAFQKHYGMGNAGNAGA